MKIVNMKPISVPIFVLEVVLFWILWFIYSYAWVHGVDLVSDVLRFVSVVGMLVIVVSGVLTIIQIKRDFSEERSITIGNKILTVSVFIAFIIIHLVMYISFSDMGYSSFGLYSIADKHAVGDSFYLYIKSPDDGERVEIKCTKEVYEELIIDAKVSYTFTYRWLTFNKDKGILQGSIDTTDIIDNRREN